MNENGDKNSNGSSNGFNCHNSQTSPSLASSFLKEGNKHFLLKEFHPAVQSYTEGLEVLGSESEKGPQSLRQDLRCNRALALISLGRFRPALEDTSEVLREDPRHPKAILRHSKSLAGLGRFQEAVQFLREKVKLVTVRKPLEEYLDKLKWQKELLETGRYFERGKATSQIMDRPFEPAPEDWVDYLGPVLIQKIEGKGRGLIAGEDLPPGKLVMGCRAFEIMFLDPKSDPEASVSVESGEELNSGKFRVEEDATLNLLARKVYDRLKREPERRSEFYRLHAGNELGFLEDDKTDSDSIPPLDMARIYGICRTNTFANAGDSYPEVEKSVGIWLFPAFVNHQCIGGNCSWKIFGDFIFVRVGYRKVLKGEELTHSYVSPAFPFHARNEVLTKRLGFVCQCKLCLLDRSLPASVHEEKLKLKQLALNQEVKFGSNPQPHSNKAGVTLLEQIISKLEKLQPDHGTLNASLIDPLQKLGLKYFSLGDFHQTTKVMERACGLMKACMLPHGVADCALWIIAAYLQLGNQKQGKKWGKVLKENLILAYGDLHVLRILGPWVIPSMTEWGLLQNEDDN